MSFNCYPITLTQEDHRKRAEIFWKMQDEGLDKTVFYSLEKATIQHWLDICTLPQGWCVPVYTAQGKLCAAGWVNSFIGRTAFTHFVVFKAYQAHAVDIGHTWLKSMFATQCFDSLLGLTPATFRHALNFIQKLGFELSPIKAPGACYLAKQKRHVAGVFSCIQNTARLKG